MKVFLIAKESSYNLIDKACHFKLWLQQSINSRYYSCTFSCHTHIHMYSDSYYLVLAFWGGSLEAMERILGRFYPSWQLHHLEKMPPSSLLLIQKLPEFPFCANQSPIYNCAFSLHWWYSGFSPVLIQLWTFLSWLSFYLCTYFLVVRQLVKLPSSCWPLLALMPVYAFAKNQLSYVHGFISGLSALFHLSTFMSAPYYCDIVLW